MRHFERIYIRRCRRETLKQYANPEQPPTGSNHIRSFQFTSKKVIMNDASANTWAVLYMHDIIEEYCAHKVI